MLIFRFILLPHPTKTELNPPSPEKKHFLESVFSCCWVSTVGIFSKSTDVFSKQIYERILYRKKQVIFVQRVSMGCLLTEWSLQSWTAIILCRSKKETHWSPWEIKFSYKFNSTIPNIVFWVQNAEMFVTVASVYRNLPLSRAQSHHIPRAVCSSLHWEL